ncbi:MAG: carbon-nitrogen family hydrolase [Deltaproteobacteria bacterium]|nr:carbon-nitrogen family hydrolase [Deltaproteobacteria bacterium]
MSITVKKQVPCFSFWYNENTIKIQAIKETGYRAINMKLTIALAQISVDSTDTESNLKKGAARIAEAAERGAELICFPEMWTTGFNWNRLTSATYSHTEAMQRIAELAAEHRIWVSGSLALRSAAGRVTNTALLFSPEGKTICTYDKIHLFSVAQEDKYLEPGSRPTLIDAPWGPTGFAICYDLRFPELFRTYALQGTTLIICPAAFPLQRLSHWQTLVQARAIENQLFMVAVNQVGLQRFGALDPIPMGGSSMLVDPWGTQVAAAAPDDEQLVVTTIELDEAERIRKKIPVFRDRNPAAYNL